MTPGAFTLAGREGGAGRLHLNEGGRKNFHHLVSIAKRKRSSSVAACMRGATADRLLREVLLKDGYPRRSSCRTLGCEQRPWTNVLLSGWRTGVSVLSGALSYPDNTPRAHPRLAAPRAGPRDVTFRRALKLRRTPDDPPPSLSPVALSLMPPSTSPLNGPHSLSDARPIRPPSFAASTANTTNKSGSKTARSASNTSTNARMH